MRKACAVLLLCFVACRREPGITAEPDPAPARPAWEPIAPPRAATASMVLERYRAPPSECELGEMRSCGFSIRVDRVPVMMHCMTFEDGSRHFSREECNTPLVPAFDEAPVVFTEAPGDFAIGVSRRTQWVSSATPWLVLDADGSGCIESERELFGVANGAANGFDELGRLDANGDGRLDALDPSFARLALWYDRDQDRTCTPNEVVSLDTAGVVAIDLGYTPRGPSRGRSFEGERSTFVRRDGSRGRVIDVYLAPR